MKIRVEEIMTSGVIALREGDTVARADEEMRLADIRHIPVVDERNHVVGVVSNRDLLLALGSPSGRRRRIGEVMTRDVMTVLPEMPAFRAAEMMMERKIGSLPVVDEHETLIGIITESDFLGIAHQALHGHTGSELLRI